MGDLGRNEPGRTDVEVDEAGPHGRDPEHHRLLPEGVVLLQQAHLDELADAAVGGPVAALPVLPGEEAVGHVLPGDDPMPADPLDDRPVPGGDDRTRTWLERRRCPLADPGVGPLRGHDVPSAGHFPLVASRRRHRTQFSAVVASLCSRRRQRAAFTTSTSPAT